MLLYLVIGGLLLVVGLLVLHIASRDPVASRCCRCGDPHRCPLRRGRGSSLSAGK
ncbi:hypothetical protein H9654_04050 [Stenotrophomonas sp. Sa5BUN4]|uniref:FeoB-associated Cys-rich membrane protein n=1 Tax=Stenotrophomonas lacuserhaii TaxID=2760084 RepID=A0A8X8FTW7_9GAMM|nr:hypothetical protein [Stenotrophomonas pennii]MBD7953373.1 hypothetical protein [Stenotrophomonas pennii]